ncbi:unnamed protein product, partial [Didymodactylos carnosus]
LYELDLLPNFTLPNNEYFREHFEKDYLLFGQQLVDSEQSIIWIFKILNHMLQNIFLVNNFLDMNLKVIELEKLVEENLILPHIRSVTDEINDYKLAYTDFVEIEDKEVTFDAYVNELNENEEIYPFLKFFNVITVYTVDPLIEKTIDYYVNEKQLDYKTLLQLYENFVHAWFKLNFKKVQFDCQTAILERTEEQKDFVKNAKFAVVLLNTSKDTSSIALAGCLKTMAELQNDIVNFYHKNIYTNIKTQRTVSLQAIQLEHVLRLNADEISTKLRTNYKRLFMIM